MRLIDADALNARFEELKDNPQNTLTDIIFLDGAMSVVDAAPTIDCAPVIHAKWVHGVTLNHEWMKCSACNVSQTPNGCFSFCPNCGAKMYVEDAKMDGGRSDGQT